MSDDPGFLAIRRRLASDLVSARVLARQSDFRKAHRALEESVLQVIEILDAVTQKEAVK